MAVEWRSWRGRRRKLTGLPTGGNLEDQARYLAGQAMAKRHGQGNRSPDRQATRRPSAQAPGDVIHKQLLTKIHEAADRACARRLQTPPPAGPPATLPGPTSAGPPAASNAFMTKYFSSSAKAMHRCLSRAAHRRRVRGQFAGRRRPGHRPASRQTRMRRRRLRGVTLGRRRPGPAARSRRSPRLRTDDGRPARRRRRLARMRRIPASSPRLPAGPPVISSGLMRAMLAWLRAVLLRAGAFNSKALIIEDMLEASAGLRNRGLLCYRITHNK